MPQLFNACEYLLDRRLAAGDGPRVALTGVAGDVSYAALHDQVRRTATSLRALGLQPEQRVLMLMSDSPQFVVTYLAAMRMGAIPVPVSTMLHADGMAELLQRLAGPVPGRHPGVRGDRRRGRGRGARAGRDAGRRAPAGSPVRAPARRLASAAR